MKTIEEEAMNIRTNKAVLYSNPKMILIHSFKSGVEFAQRWISIIENPPSFNDKGIIVKTKYGEYLLFNHLNLACIQLYEITHWRLIEIK